MSNDVVLKPADIPDRVLKKSSPVYVVSLDSGWSLIAIKFDDGPNYGKFIGFYSLEDSDAISEKYIELVGATEKHKYVEVMIPWNRILSVRSLTFKQK